MTLSISSIWLQAACAITILFGLVSTAASFPPTQGIWLTLFDLLKWPMDGNPVGFDLTARPLNAVLGGLMVGWGAMMFLLVRSFYKTHTRIIRKILLIGIVTWFVVDSTGSLLAEIPGNVILNLSFLLMFLLPLVLVRKDLSN